MVDDKDSPDLGRRQFLRSIFGLGTVAETQTESPAEAQSNEPKIESRGKFFWTDLKTGQIGFPCGHNVPSGMPGSLMKLVSAAALSDAHIIPIDQKFECRGSYTVNRQKFTCLYAHGIIDLVHAIGLSCNIYFAQAAQKMSASTLLNYAERFGLNQSVAGFPSGKFPAKAAYPSSENYVLGLAEDMQPSALQILRVSALIANQGKVPFMHSAESPDPNGKSFQLELNEQTWHVLQQGMKIAARQGTGKKLDQDNRMQIAIKTGTTPHGKSFQSWITGYFPWSAPRYAFVLRAFNGTSQEKAVPQARSFLFATEWP